MTVCANCGQHLDDAELFCTACGTAVELAAAPAAEETFGAVVHEDPAFAAAASAAAANPDPVANAANAAKDFVTKLLDTPDYTEAFQSEDLNNQTSKLMSILAYLSLLVLIPMFAFKHSAYTRFHTNQGLILAILGVAYSLLSGGIAAIFGLIAPVLGAIFGWLFGIVGLVFLAYTVLGIVNVVTGKAKELPIIGKYRILD